MAAPAGNAPIALATIVDGEATLIREASKFTLAEGVRLRHDDIVESGGKARLVRIEFGDGDMIDLGPDTRIILAPALPAQRTRVPAKAYVLQGWVKWTAPKASPPGAIVSPVLDIYAIARSAVFGAAEDQSVAFAESGELTLVEHRDGSNLAPQTLKAEQFFSRAGSDKSSVANRPSPAFIQRVPRSFVDSIPSRAALFKSKEAEPKRTADIAYADVRAWVNAEPALRRLFVARWRAKAHVPEFRKGLQADLEAHPEWDRILNPEKYLPKTPPGGPVRY